MLGRVLAVLGKELDDGGATIAPSERSAIFFACSGVEMPKPMAQGISVFSRTRETMEARSLLISLRSPVTPSDETI